MAMHKTADLDPNGNYVFCYHPHGIISLGAGAAFSTEALGWSSHFPGVHVALLALAPIFQIPFYREWMLAHGNAPPNRSTCHSILRSGPGRSICLVVGGASESLEARPNNMKLTLANRRGFVRVAVATGASLVPAIGFGENELFEQLDHPSVRAIQEKTRRWLSFALPIFYARGIFQYYFGLVPYRHPVNVVVGAPIEVPKQASPDPATVEAIHKKYLDAVKALYDEHRPKFGGAAEIRFV